MTRRSLSTTHRMRIFEISGGICHICNERIQVGQKWEVEHVRALALLGLDADDNMRPAHKTCHTHKTKDDRSRIAKAKRQRAKHLGAIKKVPWSQWRKRT
jgi:5-methylcytosine-specific restriction endonuclease McrA